MNNNTLKILPSQILPQGTLPLWRLDEITNSHRREISTRNLRHGYPQLATLVAKTSAALLNLKMKQADIDRLNLNMEPEPGLELAQTQPKAAPPAPLQPVRTEVRQQQPQPEVQPEIYIPLKSDKTPAIMNWQNTQLGAYDSTGNYGIVPQEPDLVIDCDPRNYPDALETNDPFQSLPVIEAICIARATNGKPVSLPDGTVRTEKKKKRDILVKLLQDIPELSKTRKVKTPSGHHFHCKKPANVHITESQPRYPGIEFKSKGRYVVGPGSYFIDAKGEKGEPGKRYDYVLEQDALKIQLSLELLTSLVWKTPPVNRGDDNIARSLSMHERFKADCLSWPLAISGNRGNNTTYNLTCVGIRDYNLPDDIVFEVLRDIYNPRLASVTETWSDAELWTFVRNANNYGQNARGCETSEFKFAGMSPTSNGAVTADNDWPELRPLQRELDPPEPYPLDALGNILGGAAKAAQVANQVPDGMCGNSFLAAAGLATQAHVNVIVDGRTYPLAIYANTIALSGERKTETDKLALYPIHERQRALILTSKDEQREYITRKAIYDRFHSNALNATKIKDKSPEEVKAELLKLNEPQAPLEKIFVCGDPTWEGIVKSFVNGQPSQGCFNDEAGLILSGHGFNKENLLKTIAGFSSLWGGKIDARLRGGDSGSIVMYGVRLSIHWMFQPYVAQILFTNDLIKSQGFLARMLISYPTSVIGSRRYKEVNVSESAEILAYTNKMRELLAIPFPIAENTRNLLAPRKIQLSVEAKSLYMNFHNDVEGNLKDNGKFAPIREFASKAAEHAVRIAGVLAVFDTPEITVITGEHMTAGVDLARYYLNEALRIFGISGLDPDLTLAQKLYAWLCSRENDFVSLVEVYQRGPAQMRDNKAAGKIMQILADHGYVRQSHESVMYDGMKRKSAWQIRRF